MPIDAVDLRDVADLALVGETQHGILAVDHVETGADALQIFDRWAGSARA
jgi:hypothetical protein